ncbi:hypothetical protein [Streptomyces sp. NPDC001970]
MTTTAAVPIPMVLAYRAATPENLLPLGRVVDLPAPGSSSAPDSARRGARIPGELLRWRFS